MRPTRCHAAALAALLCTLIGIRAQAQIVNVQSTLAALPDEGVSGSLTGSADWRTGNSSLLLIGTSAALSYRRGAHLVVGIGRLDFAQAKNPDSDRYERISLKTFGHLRYRRTLSKRLLVETFQQAEYDEQRRLNLRALIGAGVRLGLVEQTQLRVGLGLAYMFEYEDLQDDWVNDDESTQDSAANHRISSYLVGSYIVDDRTQLMETLYVQPLVIGSGPGDVRLLSESQLLFKLSKSLTMSTSLVLSLDSKPPVLRQDPTVAVERLDTALKSSITYAF